MRPTVNVDLSICLQKNKNLEVSEVTSWSRHLLLITDREYYSDDYFLELVTAVLRIIYLKSLDMMQLCLALQTSKHISKRF